ncbi:hypothetical protein PIB30_017477 [Stylosanthes scabra]|uniref:Transposase MuDR plant domain-containing protein n=1 Tax=Stylosanthes scabra TaxID=79078 RepID=A0ABU6Z667_9FABA|nr:hypothetical protein [Stylosanthes scabra]
MQSTGRVPTSQVGNRFLSLQHNMGHGWMLVWLLNDEHVRVTFECHRRLMEETIMELLVVVTEAGGSSIRQPSEPPGPPVHATPLCIAEPAGEVAELELGSSEISRRQLDLDAMRISDPLQAGLADYYNTDGGVEFRVGHWLRNQEAVHMAVKNYNVRRNAEYRVVESDRIKYHCRCKHAVDGCP